MLLYRSIPLAEMLAYKVVGVVGSITNDKTRAVLLRKADIDHCPALTTVRAFEYTLSVPNLPHKWLLVFVDQLLD